ncbi:MAG: ornithine cyclodeaminase family protein, partial [Acidobacteria bacterium]|nr:ornithine cyclodeaminase family protein [Acidobacteriota bacterium]
ELGEVVLGRIAGRTAPDEVTLFKSLGMAVEDVAAAHLAYVKAAERGLGRGFVL